MVTLWSASGRRGVGMSNEYCKAVDLQWHCSLPLGHLGKHIAMRGPGVPIAEWAQQELIPPSATQPEPNPLLTLELSIFASKLREFAAQDEMFKIESQLGDGEEIPESVMTIHGLLVADMFNLVYSALTDIHTEFALPSRAEFAAECGLSELIFQKQ